MNKTKLIDSLKSLHDLSKAINSTLDIDEVEEMILEKTARLMQAKKVLILLLDKTKTILTLHTSLGLAREELKIKRFHDIRSFDHCIAHKGTVITMDEVLTPNDLQLQRREMPFLSGIVFAPLEIKGEAYGLLGISGYSHEFSIVELEIFCSLGSQAAIALENAHLYKKLHDAFLHTAEALAEAINSRDPYTGGHTSRVSQYALQLAGPLGLSAKEKEDLRLAAILHDIGKIGIDDAVLRKSGSFSAAEKEMMKQHPEIGANILEHVDEMGEVIKGVRHHHEWFDGSGYPDGLAWKDIPLIARIISIVDVFDALTTDRPYRKASNKKVAIKIMLADSGSHFDPELLDIFSREEL